MSQDMNKVKNVIQVKGDLSEFSKKFKLFIEDQLNCKSIDTEDSYSDFECQELEEEYSIDEYYVFHINNKRSNLKDYHMTYIKASEKLEAYVKVHNTILKETGYSIFENQMKKIEQDYTSSDSDFFEERVSDLLNNDNYKIYTTVMRIIL